MEAEKMLRLAISVLVFSAVLAIPILADNTANFKQIFFLGKGIAASTSNNQDLHIVKAGVAQISVNVVGTDIDVSIGILYFDDLKYVLKDLTIGDNTTSGNIYNGSSVVGSFSLNLVSKLSDDIWAGTLTLSGQTYNAYILAAHRKYTTSEEAQSVSDYCQAHNSDDNCRGKVEDFCQSNPTDQRCVALLHNYCKSHLLDGRCREDLKDLCHGTSTDTSCSEFCAKYPKICNLHTTSTTSTRTTTTKSTTTTISALEKSCTDSGGTVGTSMCCQSAHDFPNSCLIGACGCSPTNSHSVKTCECPAGQCFDGEKCVSISASTTTSIASPTTTTTAG